MDTKEIKNIIIGFGKGGKTLAKFLASKNEEVLVIENLIKCMVVLVLTLRAYHQNV